MVSWIDTTKSEIMTPPNSAAATANVASSSARELMAAERVFMTHETDANTKARNSHLTATAKDLSDKTFPRRASSTPALRAKKQQTKNQLM